jgi:HK97 family phage prohead protease
MSDKKKNTKLQYANYEMKAVTEDSKVVIEGWANKAKVDSCGDYMVPSGCDTKRFGLNPIIFFNHDRDYPIGKATAWKPDDEKGLWLRAEISESDNPKIQFVRDLIKEGILKTYSIGYNERQAERMADNSRKVTDWELHEVSVVSLPMNDESTFSLGKDFKTAFDANDFETARSIIVKSLSSNKAQDNDEEPQNENTEGESSENTDASKSEFQECVAAKIPKLIEEGKPQDEAVAIAMAMCRDEGKCAVPSQDDWMKFAQVAEDAVAAHAAKQASMIPTETQAVQGEGVPLQNDLIARFDTLIRVTMEISGKLDQVLRYMEQDAQTEGEDESTSMQVTGQQAANPALEKRAQALETSRALLHNIDEKLKTMGF